LEQVKQSCTVLELDKSVSIE